MSIEMAERVVAQLAAERRLTGVHLAGGEPTIRLDLLVEVIRMAASAGVCLSYVETNAHWCSDREETEDTLRRLKEAGLPGILVSVSMFHNEFIPFRNSRNCVEAARAVLGWESTHIYLPHMYGILAKMPDDGRHSLEEFVAWAGLEGRPELVAQLYSVIPSGRAVDALRDAFPSRPAHHFRKATCFVELMSTSHFHVDQHGDLFTGLCAGIAPATVEDLHPRIEPGTHPVFSRLIAEGPWGLMKTAQASCGYRARERGYVSKCDLCLDVRDSLYRTGEFSELRPASFYCE
jgi:MoaA/NifB/PqqE/SkfB family radical SAM enzyme